MRKATKSLSKVIGRVVLTAFEATRLIASDMRHAVHLELAQHVHDGSLGRTMLQDAPPARVTSSRITKEESDP
ncbi:hypothetical protein [Variovorax sp. YR216]|uniref:hypothetical protein n=1 Tax=Variovorax sp. YR216 TaxID=1882828 RepID=UPI00089D6BBD|nr:hypothetical protein [Variovorax sp. YR216]SEB22403.1 hypothetical protein SAMN05444680_11631 [Variovorax sp. YR216]